MGQREGFLSFWIQACRAWGLNPRYIPPNHGLLDRLTTLLFWVGTYRFRYTMAAYPPVVGLLCRDDISRPGAGQRYARRRARRRGRPDNSFSLSPSRWTGCSDCDSPIVNNGPAGSWRSRYWRSSHTSMSPATSTGWSDRKRPRRDSPPWTRSTSNHGRRFKRQRQRLAKVDSTWESGWR